MFLKSRTVSDFIMKLLRSFSLEYTFRYAAFVYIAIALFSVLESLCADISVGRSNVYPGKIHRYCTPSTKLSHHGAGEV